MLDVNYEWDRIPVPDSLREFEARWANRRHPLDFSGVWRFRELLPFAAEDKIVTIGEGQTILQQSDVVGQYVGMNDGELFLQYEGLNPSGSFKDNGMTAVSTHARIVGATKAACASTGNTSASLAIFAGTTKLFQAIVFVGSGTIAYGKLSQALDYGALTIQIQGDFDDALIRVQEVCAAEGIYLCNSVNPFRLEGQKAIMYRVLEGLNWDVPDWIVVPGGNLGNSSAFGKAFLELKQLGLIDRIPRLAVINATGANTLYQLHEQQGLRWNGGHPDAQTIDTFYAEMDAQGRKANTLASAIQINRPVNLLKCLRALEICNGVVREVSDQDILDAKAQVGAGGFGCEPASGAGVAGAKLLREEGVIAPSDRVVCILTGHELKDPNATIAYHSTVADQADETPSQHSVTKARFANQPIVVANDLQQIIDTLRKF
ncbi:MAG: threonine synthase [Planctomycetes bacterium]|nr:threonine synthase [Planctomycetota bacterium]